ncbi:LOW QUALITY PROTEIN: uncharacterized protein LOC135474754 [Liolophura sinensis]|uniref:LOW QUALITY PROTEIN: uncharacterized protein LOC135474754 n=1 Tax=Liolophura sinensis TaxID=3198878 RepID=UPI003158D519
MSDSDSDLGMSTARDRLRSFDSRHDPRVQQLLHQETKGYRKASVFIGLLYSEDRLNVLLTLRSSRLQHHANTVSFPGGKVDEGDQDEVEAALREAKEEVGLEPSNVEVVCTLSPMIASPNFLTVPVVGFIKEQFELKVNENEVEEVFYLPLERFNKDEGHSSEVFMRSSSSSPYIIHRFTDTVIGQTMITWGFTANYCCLVANIVFNKQGFSYLSQDPVSAKDAYEQTIQRTQRILHVTKTHELAKM